MKSINNSDNLKIMCNRHGEIFEQYIKRSDINKDYSNCPLQVLIQPKIFNEMIKKIENYNLKNNTNFGYLISSLLSLIPITNKKNKKIQRQI